MRKISLCALLHVLLLFINCYCEVVEDNCSMQLVESIPENLTFSPGSPTHLSTYNAWRYLIESARATIDIGSFYWTLRGTPANQDPTDCEGESIFRALMDVGSSEKVKVRIVQSEPSSEFPNNDTAALAASGAAQVRSLNLERLVGGGVLHTKFWIVDSKHFYIGSANFDWRSLTQVKEMGIMALDCSCLAGQLSKAFEMYWSVALPNATIPSAWPPAVDTQFNVHSPLCLQINETSSLATFGIDPPEFVARGWSSDLDVILHVIDSATTQINVAVMDYFPTTLYDDPNTYWPIIDDALRRAAFNRGVRVRLLASRWNHTFPDMFNYLRSLAALNGTTNENHAVHVEAVRKVYSLFLLIRKDRQRFPLDE
ncbi:5'-3' exonuclease PLD3-like isoform X2 [Oscarella lobularis]|uniref:5'-3' exonuclease PLD3-like isoform X2 n=1 Tax=Oscarella lobularis TaxID=121494 RepID=UPI00331383D6